MSVECFPPFRPHPLLRSAHAQTLFAFYVRPAGIRYQARRHEISLSDGDAIVLHDDCPANWREGDRVVLMIPGLGGSHQSPFMPRIATKLNSAGFRTSRLDLRGFGVGYRLARLPGHAGRSEDSTAAVKKIAELSPNSPVTAIGFSMGGNIVLKMLGEIGGVPLGKLDSCVAIAPPIDLLNCSLHMLRPMNRMYSRFLVLGLLKQVKRRQPFVEGIRRLALTPRPKNLMEFDDRFTAPVSGFVDAHDYYSKCSSGPLMHDISLPALVITASDDPLIPVSMFDDFALSSSTTLVVTEKGGHLGFVGARGVDPDRRWLDWRIVDWIDWHDKRAGAVQGTDCEPMIGTVNST